MPVPACLSRAFDAFFLASCMYVCTCFVIDLKLYTFQEVLNRLIQEQNAHPAIFCNPTRNTPGGPMEPFNKSPHLSVGDETEKHSVMSTKMGLLNKAEATDMNRHLKKRARKTYISTPMNGLCLYQALLDSLYPYIKRHPNFPVYTAVHLKYQFFMHTIDNWRDVDYMYKAYLEMYGPNVSVNEWIWHYLMSDEWSDMFMLDMIAAMWRIKITVFDARCGASDWALEEHKFGGMGNHQPLQAHAVLVYNGENHFTGSGERL